MALTDQPALLRSTSSSLSTSPVYAYIHNVLKSPVVCEAIPCYFPALADRFSGGAQALWIKEHTLELRILTSGLGDEPLWTTVIEQPVFGQIRAVAVCFLRKSQLASYGSAASASTDARCPCEGNENETGEPHVVCTSDSGYLSILRVECDDDGRAQFVAVQQIALDKPGLDSTELGHAIAVDPLSRALAVSALEQKVKIYDLSDGTGSIAEAQFVIVEETGIIWRIAFVQPDSATDLVRLVIVKTSNGALSVVITEYDATKSFASMRRWAEHVVAQDAVPLEVLALRSLPNSLIIITDSSMHFVRIGSTRLELVDLPPLRISQDTPVHQTPIAATRTCSHPLASADTIFVATEEEHLFRLDFAAGEKEVSIRHVEHVKFSVRAMAAFPMLDDASGDGSTWVAMFGDMCDGVTLALDANSTPISESTIPNWAPIVDFKLVDIHREGHDSLLLTSGRLNHSPRPAGSIREIRNGIAVNVHASVEDGAVGASALWGLKRGVDSKEDTFIVISFVDETRVMALQDGELEDISAISGFDTSFPTLCASALSLGKDTLHAQIHSHGVVISNLSDCIDKPSEPVRKLAWEPPPEDSNVADEGHTRARLLFGGAVSDLLVVCTAKMVYCLQVVRQSFTGFLPDINIRRVAQVDLSIAGITPSCLYTFSLPTLAPDDVPSSIPPAPRRFCAIGTFSPSILLLSLNSDHGSEALSVAAHVSLDNLGAEGSICIPQSFAVVRDSDSAHENPGSLFLAGLRDGTLVSFRIVSEASGGISLTQAKARRLGYFPVQLVTDTRDAADFALALADTPWKVSVGELGETKLESLSCPRIIHATPFNFPNIAHGYMTLSKNSMQFIELDTQKRINMRAAEVDQIPRRILYDEVTRKAVVAVSSPGNSRNPRSEIIVMDSLSGKVYVKEKLQPNEVVYALTSWNVKEGKRYICVGTWGYIPPSPPSPDPNATPERKGRVLVYNLKAYEKKDRDRDTSMEIDDLDVRRRPTPEKKSVMYKMKRLGEMFLKGPVHAISPFVNSYLLASAGDVFYQLKIDAHTRKLVVRTTVQCRWPIQSIGVYGTRVVMGGQRESVSYWDYDLATKKFTFLKSDRYSRPIADCLPFSDSLTMATDKCGTLVCFSSGSNSAATERTLDTVFSFYLGETIPKLHMGSLSKDLTSHQSRAVASAVGSSSLYPSAKPPIEGVPPAESVRWPGTADDDVISILWHSASEGPSSSVGTSTVSLPDASKADFSKPVRYYQSASRSVSQYEAKLHSSAEVLYGCSVLGSVFAIARIEKDAYRKLKTLEEVLAQIEATKPLLGNDHSRYRAQGPDQPTFSVKATPSGPAPLVPITSTKPHSTTNVIDGILISQFLLLSRQSQSAIMDLWNERWAELNPIMMLQGEATAQFGVDDMLRLIRGVQRVCC
ncbi:mono-functional DNA-alkylating methyl methanesulfonate N-term-domain-containing protein [Fimicolochytrium jonesii]|uniref:mono-functional DNA-alkylating methyl methanesulfonate N-term-domain-containing protein n=1 Tax=Fimicolochytrium jonesii TaxID=1396493 RepID=UPI0022FE7754|nr:mono-functional DNA-alkylating methyl methanesulfonate N-term-domain-containing protein [Fimicolochytrium jonesii]KAI8817058.1 mono-functional DNA-alkylating methyl methanesulfonate N-term-domain-containing protein [Fimicolochytrium jonesii]